MPNKLGSSLVFPVKGLVKRRTPSTSPLSSSNRSQSSHAAPRKAAQSLKRWDVSSGYLKTLRPCRSGARRTPRPAAAGGAAA